MKKIYLLILASLLLPCATRAWNGTVHTGIAAVADANLTPTAKKYIADIFDGHTIINYAYWLDDVAETDGYSRCNMWHNVAITAKNKIIVPKKAAKSKVDAVKSALALEGVSQAIATLEKRDKLTKEEIADNIRFVVYILADLHCPSHYVYADLLDERAMCYYRDPSKKVLNYMSFWEGQSITTSFSWNANEYVHQLSRKSKEDVDVITSGTIYDWVEANAAEYRYIYPLMTPDKHFKDKEFRLWLNKVYPFATEQAAVAGYRIARVLNGLLDDSVAPVAVK